MRQAAAREVKMRPDVSAISALQNTPKGIGNTPPKVLIVQIPLLVIICFLHYYLFYDFWRRAVDVVNFLSQQNAGLALTKYPIGQIFYGQGEPSHSVFYVSKGKVKVTVVSEHGKEAVVAIRGPDEFCGEEALNGIPLRLCSAHAMTECEVVRIEKEIMMRLLHTDPAFADYFLTHLLTRTAKVEADLVDQLFNSSEMRLARALLLLANYGNDSGPEPIPLQVNQETLAALIGTTRSRVNVFMNKFRKLGLIEYNGHLKVQKALLNFVLHQKPHIEEQVSGDG